MERRRAAQAGFTIVEVTLVTSFVGILTLLIVQSLADLTKSQAFTRGQARIQDVADRALRGVVADTGFAVRVFTDGEEADSYLAALAYPRGQVMAGSRLASLTQRGYFDNDTAERMETGNMLMVGRFERPELVELTTLTGTKEVRIDTLSFVLYYLTRTAEKHLDLGRWGSGRLARYKDVMAITDPVERAVLLRALHDRGVHYAWDTSATSAAGLYTIESSGVATPLPSGEQLPGDPEACRSGLLAPSRARISKNGRVCGHRIPSYALAGENGFPGGFEIKVDGPSTGKLVLLRIVVRSGRGDVRDNATEVMRLVSARDG